MPTRVLFLDDSGKPDMNHPSGAVVIGGLAVPSRDVPTLSRRILGAKSKYLPSRGHPASWEIKSTSFVKPNPWKRSKNRAFVAELVRIVGSVGGSFYSVSLEKARMNHPMSLAQTMPLQLQALVEHFEVECRHNGETGLVIADWSSHHADNHASRCVASFVASRKLRIHPSVYYASSHTTEAVQVADLVAAIRRRAIEGDTNLAGVDATIAKTRTIPNPTLLRTYNNRIYENQIQLF